MKLLNSFFSWQFWVFLLFEIPLLIILVNSDCSLEIKAIIVFIWFISIFGLHGLVTSFENFNILEKHLNPNQPETKKDGVNDKPKTEKEIYREKIQNLLEYIKRTKTILSVKPDGMRHIILTFTDRTTLKIWVANKYFGFASGGEYIGRKGGKIVWKYVYLKEGFSKVFDCWIKNFQTESKTFEEERAEYCIERPMDNTIPIEDYGFKSGEEK